MSDYQEVHQNDVGTQFILTITEKNDNTGLDEVVKISTATVKKMIFYLKNKTTLVRDASFYTDGEDGKLSYITVPGDMSSVGTCRVQAYVVLPTGKWYTSIGEFVIKDNLATIVE